VRATSTPLRADDKRFVLSFLHVARVLRANPSTYRDFRYLADLHPGSSPADDSGSVGWEFRFHGYMKILPDGRCNPVAAGSLEVSIGTR